MSECVVVSGTETSKGRQGLTYFEGISAESARSQALCIHSVVFPPRTRALAHLHESHETAIYVLEGRVDMLYGNGLKSFLSVCAGDFLYIPAGMPHLPFNPSHEDWAKGIVSRTDPRQLESITLLPELEAYAQEWLETNGYSDVSIPK